MGCSAHRVSNGSEGERHERQEPDGGEQRPGDEPEAVARVAPVQREPADGEDGVDGRDRDRDVPEREDRDGQRECEPEPRVEPAGEAGRDHEERDELRWPEREERRAERRGDDSQHDGEHAARMEASRGYGLLDLDPPLLARRPTLRLPRGVAQLRGQIGRGGTSIRVDRESRIHSGHEAAGKSAPLRGERRRTRLDRLRDLLDRHAPERVPVGEGLPEEDADRPDVALGAGIGARQALGGDVRERPGDVADGGQRVRAVELREPEVEQPHGDLVAILEEDVRGLDVPVHDSRAVGVSERVEHLRGRVDRVLVREHARTDGVAHRAPWHVLVRDVDVSRVVADVVGAHAAVVAQAAGCERLSLRACGRLAFARNDLERDVEAVLLVEREPDGARAARSERSHGPVAPEDELLSGRDGRDGRHR